MREEALCLTAWCMMRGRMTTHFHRPFMASHDDTVVVYLCFEWSLVYMCSRAALHHAYSHMTACRAGTEDRNAKTSQASKETTFIAL